MGLELSLENSLFQTEKIAKIEKEQRKKKERERKRKEKKEGASVLLLYFPLTPTPS